LESMLLICVNFEIGLNHVSHGLRPIFLEAFCMPKNTRSYVVQAQAKECTNLGTPIPALGNNDNFQYKIILKKICIPRFSGHSINWKYAPHLPLFLCNLWNRPPFFGLKPH
jgi:hypothetical protein